MYFPDVRIVVYVQLVMSSSGNSAEYAAKRQKNNEQCRASRLKRKEYEMEIARKKPMLEVTYVRLQREVNHLMRCL